MMILVIPRPVSAYLDPGVGSVVWQLVIAVGFGLVFTLKIYWKKIKDYVGHTRKTDKND
jgi:hypothetical protein